MFRVVDGKNVDTLWVIEDISIFSSVTVVTPIVPSTVFAMGSVDPGRLWSCDTNVMVCGYTPSPIIISVERLDGTNSVRIESIDKISVDERVVGYFARSLSVLNVTWNSHVSESEYPDVKHEHDAFTDV